MYLIGIIPPIFVDKQEVNIYNNRQKGSCGINSIAKRTIMFRRIEKDGKYYRNAESDSSTGENEIL